MYSFDCDGVALLHHCYRVEQPLSVIEQTHLIVFFNKNWYRGKYENASSAKLTADFKHKISEVEYVFQ